MKNLLLILTTLLSLSGFGQEYKDYPIIINEIQKKKASFRLDFSKSDSLTKDSLIIVAREYLIHTITEEIFPSWYGTEWDFNGMTRTPQVGKISCGYFVTNVLTDAGFNIPRIKWAQSPSEIFIKKLAFGAIKRFSDKPISIIEEYLLKSGNGIYLVGLDYHTGFLLVNNADIQFIHADYYEPELGVISEKIDSHSPILDSKYRVIGKLMSDEMIEHWILNLEIK